MGIPVPCVSCREFLRVLVWGAQSYLSRMALATLTSRCSKSVKANALGGEQRVLRTVHLCGEVLVDCFT
jgi:hypothetical protein